MASIIDGEATLSHGAQDIDDCIDDVASASGTFESLAERVNSIDGRVEDLEEGGGGGGTTDYEQLSNQPQINGVTLQGNKTASALGLQAEIGSSSKLSSDFVTDINATNMFVTSAEKSTWNGKQDAISDLAAIRSGAAAGATAVQPSAMTAALAAKVGTDAFTTDQQRQDALEAVDRAALTKVIDGGAAGTKNLFDCSLQSIKAVTQNQSYGFSWNGNVCTSTRGVSFTINADNSITVAANTKDEVWFKLTDFMYSAGSYVISGCPTNGSTSSYYIESDALNYRDIGNGVSFTINSTTTDSIYIVVKSGQTFEKTFYPMLCSKALYDADSSYVPYAPALTNIILTPALIKQVDGGAKNKLHYNGISTSSGDTTNISFSCSGDLITITGSTSSNAAWCYLTLDGSIIVANDFCNGKYYLSSERTGSGPVDIFVHESSVGQIADDSGNGVVIPNKTTTNSVRIMVNIPKGATVNITLKIMICTAADYAVSPAFVPYRPSWQELYEMILALQSGGASTQSVQPTLMSAAKPMIETTETTELEGDEEK